jgi:hypothetical protein
LRNTTPRPARTASTCWPGKKPADRFSGDEVFGVPATVAAGTTNKKLESALPPGLQELDLGMSRDEVADSRAVPGITRKRAPSPMVRASRPSRSRPWSSPGSSLPRPFLESQAIHPGKERPGR